ncbi:MAG: anhydro-N-acetylmuramic acid kinase [bacterium]|nr:anhydro-N-acetylmuramic acid kinase [bacterium]
MFLFSSQGFSAVPKQPSLTVIGLMSGTSMDGVDVALLRTDGVTVDEYGPHKTYPYPKDLQSELRNLTNQGESAPKEAVQKIEAQITDLHAEVVKNFRAEFEIASVDLIGFHGQTFVHRPEKGYTIQLGLGQSLADQTGLPVVYDFRSGDVEHGGQGAPFAPMFHMALVAKLEHPVVIVNIGGISNITYVDKETLIACDTGMGNGLLDDWMLKKTGLDMDPNGQFAAQGTLNQSLLDGLLQDTYFAKPAPKSLDRKHFNSVLGKIDSLSTEDGALLLAALTAKSIADIAATFPKTPKAWYISGGGRHNKTMMDLLQHYIGQGDVLPIEAIGGDGDSVEAQLIAYIAVRSYYELPISFPGTTGVSKPFSGGVLRTPKKLSRAI